MQKGIELYIGVLGDVEQSIDFSETSQACHWVGSSCFKHIGRQEDVVECSINSFQREKECSLILQANASFEEALVDNVASGFLVVGSFDSRSLHL